MEIFLLLAGVIIFYVVVSHFNDKRKAEKGICQKSGQGCASPGGCACSGQLEKVNKE